MDWKVRNPTFENYIGVTKNAGPESDLLWQKQSLMFA